MNQNKFSFFADLFKLYSNNILTRQSALYRDILRYGLSKKEDYFRGYELTEWLLENNDEFKENLDSSLERSKQIENRIDRVKNNLEKLINLELILSRPTKATKGDATTKEYKITDFGCFASLLLEFDQNIEQKDEKEEQQKIEQIYNLLVKQFQKEPISSIDRFAIEYFKRCKDNGLFKIVIETLLRNFKSYPEITDVNDFDMQLIFIPLNNNETTKKLWNLWQHSLVVFQNEQKNGLFFYHSIKLHLQKILEQKIRNFFLYEESRYRHRIHPDMVTIECICKKCNIYQYEPIFILDYLSSIILGSKYFPTFKCKKCENLLTCFL